MARAVGSTSEDSDGVSVAASLKRRGDVLLVLDNCGNRFDFCIHILIAVSNFAAAHV